MAWTMIVVPLSRWCTSCVLTPGKLLPGGADQPHVAGRAARLNAVAGGAESEVSIGHGRGLGGVHLEQRGGGLTRTEWHAYLGNLGTYHATCPDNP